MAVADLLDRFLLSGIELIQIPVNGILIDRDIMIFLQIVGGSELAGGKTQPGQYQTAKQIIANLVEADLVKKPAKQQLRSGYRHALNAGNEGMVQLFLIMEIKLGLPQLMTDPLVSTANQPINLLRVI